MNEIRFKCVCSSPKMHILVSSFAIFLYVHRILLYLYFYSICFNLVIIITITFYYCWTLTLSETWLILKTNHNADFVLWRRGPLRITLVLHRSTENFHKQLRILSYWSHLGYLSYIAFVLRTETITQTRPKQPAIYFSHTHTQKKDMVKVTHKIPEPIICFSNYSLFTGMRVNNMHYYQSVWQTFTV